LIFYEKPGVARHVPSGVATAVHSQPPCNEARKQQHEIIMKWSEKMLRRLQGLQYAKSPGFKKGMTAALLVAVAAVGGFLALHAGHQPAVAEEATASGVTAPPLVLGAVFADQTNGGGSSVSHEKKLSTRPVGMHVFKTLAEVEDLEALKPGALYDVLLASLGDEGPKAHRVLRKVSVYSVAEWKPKDAGLSDIPADDADDDDDDDDEDAASSDDVIPLRVVGLLVNGAQLETLRIAEAQGVLRLRESEGELAGGAFGQIWHNFTTNLFQPLLLFFFMGFAVPLLKVPLEFPKQLYQALTLYLLVAIGWHGGELMAQQSSSELAVAGGLVVVGLIVNGFIGVIATKMLQWFTPMRKIDAVTVGAYYGSDSAGTFVTCLGILATLAILHDSYMPVLLAVMEIPGCLVGLYLVSRMRQNGMDKSGNMPGEPEFQSDTAPVVTTAEGAVSGQTAELVHKSAGAMANPDTAHKSSIFSWKIVHEVFFNPGLYLLFGGIIVGFISGIQALSDPHVVEGPNHLFIFIFKGALCLFLLEMGMTACRRLKDLKSAGWGFIAFGLLAPNLFAVIGMLALHAYSMALGHTFYLGTYALFAVLCGAASYIAVPAVQRLAIPEASPTLPLAASLGLTFTWNVTLGIPIYIEIAKAITSYMPV